MGAEIQEFPVEFQTAIDEVLVLESFSSKYDVPGAEFVSNKQVKVPRIEFKKGMSDYDKFKSDTGGKLVYDVYDLDNDKEAVFEIDAVEDADTAHIYSTKVNSEFLREKGAPEMDADFFKAVTTKAGHKSNTDLSVKNIKSEIRKARTALKQVGITNADLYIHSDALALLEDAIDRQFAGEENITDSVGKYNGFDVYEVPEDRLGQINFAVVGTNTIRYIKKRAVTYIFAPGTHTNGDCWLSQSRWVYGAVALKNKVVGMYVNNGGIEDPEAGGE